MAARSNCITIVYLAHLPKAVFKVKKADVFGLDVSVGLWVDLCGLHPARKRSKGVWGLWKIAPN